MYSHKITTPPTSRFASRPSRALRLNSPSASSESPAPFASAALTSDLSISQNSRTKTGTSRTALPIRQLTAAQKRTEPGSKANRTRTKSRLFPASASIHALDFHQFAKNTRINRTAGNISHTTRSKHALPFHLTQIWPLDFLCHFRLCSLVIPEYLRRSLLLWRGRLAFNPAQLALAPRRGPAAQTR